VRSSTGSCRIVPRLIENRSGIAGGSCCRVGRNNPHSQTGVAPRCILRLAIALEWADSRLARSGISAVVPGEYDRATSYIRIRHTGCLTHRGLTRLSRFLIGLIIARSGWWRARRYYSNVQPGVPGARIPLLARANERAAACRRTRIVASIAPSKNHRAIVLGSPPQI